MTTATTYEQILFEQQGRVGVITLNRPEKLNAWTYAMGGEMMDAIERCNNDDGIGAVVVTGAGRGFCAGADIGGLNRAIESHDASVNQPPASRAEARGERDDPAR